MGSCFKEGCHARAGEGSDYCRAHDPRRELEAVHQTGTGGYSRAVSGLYAKYLSEEERRFLLDAAAALQEGAGTALDNEIMVARLAVQRGLKADDAGALNRSLMAVNSLIRTRHMLKGEQGTGIIEAVNRVLTELNLGAPG